MYRKDAFLTFIYICVHSYSRLHMFWYSVSNWCTKWL